jgi:hypothetical protein
MRAWLRALGAASAVVVLGFAGPGCSPNAVCKIAGPINDPSNRTLRRNILGLGLGQFCKEMTTHSAPLKLAPDAPVVGRFYPAHCTQQTLDNGDIRVQFDGAGYAFTDLSRKVTFTSGASIQYNEDFKCADDNSIYAYFDTRTVSPPDFHVLQIELPGANLVQGWVTPYADNFGRQMVSGELAKGFTVIQGTDGSTDFDVGHLALGQRPLHPFNLHGKDRVNVESQRTAVAANERDFIGPISVQDGGRALYVTMQLAGQQSANILLMGRAAGDAALQLYFNYGPVGPLPVPPMVADVVHYGMQYQRAFPVPAGMYYVVIDNTPSAGQGPTPAALPFGVGASTATIDYAIQIGDAP